MIQENGCVKEKLLSKLDLNKLLKILNNVNTYSLIKLQIESCLKFKSFLFIKVNIILNL